MSQLFDKIGQKAEKLASKVQPETSATEDAPSNGDDERVVEEIESLCMNCHKNVSRPVTTQTWGVGM